MVKDFKILKAAELCKQLRFIMSYPQERYDYQNEFTCSFEKVLFTHDLLPVIYKTVCQVKSSHLYLYSAFNNTDCLKGTFQYQNRKVVCQ